VREGGVWAEGDDGVEGRAIGANFPHAVHKFSGDVQFRYAGAEQGKGQVEGLAGELGGFADQVQLLGGFDCSEGFDEATGRGELDFVGQVLIELEELGMGETFRFDAQAADPGVLEPGGDLRDQGTTDDSDVAGSLLLRLELVTGVGE
jgi:hypothetical protein